VTPDWILDVFAALMLTVAALSAARLLATRPWRPGAVVTDTDIAHLLMAIAMAGMLTAGLRTLPDGAWEVVFGIMTAWFACRVVRDARANGVRALAGGHCAPHLVHSAAMLYMFAAITAPAAGAAGMSGMGGVTGPGAQTLRYPTLAFVFALILAGYCVWDLDQLPVGLRRDLRPGPVASASCPALAGADGSVISAAGTMTAPPTVRATLLSASMTVGCRIAMGVTMCFMLLIMI
jgi:hypothetical protein